MPRGAKPKPPGEAVNRNPRVHEFKHAEAVGWQHGRTPTAPDGLLKPSRDAWRAWFGAWWASFWTPADLPALRHIIMMFDEVERTPDNVRVAAELRQQMDRYGITPKGRQDLRWEPPKEAKPAATPATTGQPRLRVVDKTG